MESAEARRHDSPKIAVNREGSEVAIKMDEDIRRHGEVGEGSETSIMDEDGSRRDAAGDLVALLA